MKRMIEHFKNEGQHGKVSFIEEEVKPMRKGSFGRLEKKYEIMVNVLEKKDRMEIGLPFTTKFFIKNIG